MSDQTIAVVGGTGPQGRGLAYRFALAGHTVIIGSRDAERAQATADEIQARTGRDDIVKGATNSRAAEKADLVLLAVPWEGHNDLAATLRSQVSGKVVISCVNPLGFDKRGPFGLPVELSAAEQLQQIAPEAAVVGAFHHVSAVSLWESDEPLHHEDVLVCADDHDAKQTVLKLAAAVTGHTGIDAGALRLARQLEPLTAVLISINKKYRTRSGITITGLTR